MSEPITSKSQMYALLAAGRLGNTTRQWFDVGEWLVSKESTTYDWWGVRSLVPGGPCRLNCPVMEVEETASRFQSEGHGVNISLMLDRICRVTLWCDIWDSPSGVIAYGIEMPPVGGSWRALMPTQGRHWHGIAAKMLLRRHLNENSYDDVFELFEKWPEHVLELSACDRQVGVFPGRNAIHWEMRHGIVGY